jgi:hypothetical protein
MLLAVEMVEGLHGGVKVYRAPPRLPGTTGRDRSLPITPTKDRPQEFADPRDGCVVELAS